MLLEANRSTALSSGEPCRSPSLLTPAHRSFNCAHATCRLTATRARRVDNLFLPHVSRPGFIWFLEVPTLRWRRQRVTSATDAYMKAEPGRDFSDDEAPPRVRGTIDQVNGNTLTIKTRSGSPTTVAAFTSSP
jgi:hypothetical protein